MARCQLTIDVQLESHIFEMKNPNDKPILAGFSSRNHKNSKNDEDEKSFQKKIFKKKLNRWPIKFLKKTDLLLPADMRAILIGAPRAGIFIKSFFSYHKEK